MEITILARQNPWWQDPDKIEEDYHIALFNESKVKQYPKLLKEFDFNGNYVYMLRGPRQVGKTTLLKLLIRDCIEKDKIPSKRILYFACDEGGIQNGQQLKEMLETYLDWVNADLPGQRVYIFLDEVTYTKEWSTGVKVVADRGGLKNVFMITTGSHAVDLKHGIERMPGRRGVGADLDKVMLPMNFREFVETTNPEMAKNIPAFRNYSQKEIYEASREIAVYDKELAGSFRKYLLCGGFPKTVANYFSEKKIDRGIYSIYRQAIIGDILKLGKREELFRQLCYVIFNKLTNPFDWQDIVQETEIGSHNTVSSYVLDLEQFFIWDVFYTVKGLGDGRTAFKKRKKVYFKDPFIFHNFRAWVERIPDEWAESQEYVADTEKLGVLVESIVGTHLKSRFKETYYWRKDYEDEIDFVSMGTGKGDMYVEVKYQSNIATGNFKRLKKSGGGILLSKQTLKYSDDTRIAIIPVHYFLSGI